MYPHSATRHARVRGPLARGLTALLTGLALIALAALPVFAQTPPIPLESGCQAAVQWVVATDEAPETVDLLFIGLAGDTITIFATGTLNDGFEEINVPCLPAGIHEGRLTVTAAGEVVHTGELRLLVAAAPVIQLNVAGEAQGEACGGLVTFAGRVLDDCGLSTGDVAVDVALLTPNGTLGTPTVSITASGDTIVISGSVLVSDITDSAAVVRVTVTAADGCALVAEASGQASVGDVTPPVVSCPEDITIDCTAQGGTPADDPQLEAFFAGFTAIDACDTALTLTNDAPEFFPLGETLVTFSATDGSGNSASCTASVAVLDTVPPRIAIELNRDVMWPPNHKFQDIVAAVTVTDDCDPDAGFVLLSIVSNESPNGHGDGNTQPDVQGEKLGTPDLEYSLRAERSGNGDGRVYTITYLASDVSGNEALGVAHVRVPHDRGGRARASNGYAAGGRAFETSDGRVAIVVPSWTDDLDGVDFDAMTIRYRRTQIGNDKGVVDVEDIYLGDVDLDARRDVVFVFSREAAEQLHLRAPGQQDKTSLHFEDTAGNDWVVYDIFELGEPVAVDLGALELYVDPVAADDSGGSEDEAAGIGSGDRAISGLLMAQPNPFSPSTTLRYVVPTEGAVSLRIYDIAGRPVRVLAEGFHAAGEYRVSWDGTRRDGGRLTPGVYLVRFEMNGVIASDKIVMLK